VAGESGAKMRADGAIRLNFRRLTRGFTRFSPVLTASAEPASAEARSPEHHVRCVRRAGLILRVVFDW
jgi:hypothetical protein